MDLVRQYIDSAVRFQPRRGGAAAGPPLRVAATLLTCATAAVVLNRLRLPPEPEGTYRFVNVHNPRCPLVYDHDAQQWSCRPGTDELPAWSISWAGAELVCGQLGGRLPTVQEWQCFASNNDPGRPFPWGDAPPTPERANFGEHYGGPSRVGSFAPSEIGLYDLAGNLDEWCLDGDEAAGPAGTLEKMVKGGAWSKDARHLAISAGRSKWARLGTTTIGLRPVWED